jgi:hypothetical protein
VQQDNSSMLAGCRAHTLCCSWVACKPSADASQATGATLASRAACYNSMADRKIHALDCPKTTCAYLSTVLSPAQVMQQQRGSPAGPAPCTPPPCTPGPHLLLLLLRLEVPQALSSW